MLHKIQNKIITLLYLTLLFIVIFFIPLKASSAPIIFKSWINTETKKSFSSNINQNSYLKNSFGFQAAKKFHNISSKITLNYNNDNKLIFDESFIEYNNKNRKFGIGKISRNWSFSPNTSLILSSNARPTDSIYFHVDNEQGSNKVLLSWMGPWSFEAFNSLTSNSSEIENSMLLGMRAVIEPIDDLKLELIKSSQWGGNRHDKSLSSFLTAAIGNTNNSKFEKINQLAGFGISFLNNIKETPIRSYAQFVGEDESGNLPSCFMKLAGSELDFSSRNFFSKIGFEFVDTRIDITSNGNCGVNSAYNNNTYNYTNYGTSIGVPIDTESKSFNIWASTKISEKLDFNYSIKKITINDASWSDHRLNTFKQSGWIADIGTSWALNSYKITSRISHQDFSLNKSNFKKGISLNFNISYNF